MAKAISTFLMFSGQAEEALSFYQELFPDSSTLNIQRYGPEGPGKEGTIVHASTLLNGLPVMVSDSPVKHHFSFTPATSFFVDCDSEQEQQRLFTRLSENGKILMPLDNYGFSRQFAWVEDRFGVSWQINLP